MVGEVGELLGSEETSGDDREEEKTEENRDEVSEVDGVRRCGVGRVVLS